MTENVINLDDHRPHMTAYVACLECAKDWIAVAPAEFVASIIVDAYEEERDGN